ncbi:hypothetical protein [Microvirga sp. VF16]|uniref:hypothetical protein n=1 Tax=Microvirga sp. VF16 TaxID=2807101 RepID=UPI00193CFD9B|nr:hypothetical protein [Microvirga sp. VF16]QRM35418.1 hypothetical protein JO965_44520 [Microvirga sp. VF16]
MTEGTKGKWSRGLDLLARSLALLLFGLFAFLLWQTIDIGSGQSIFQRLTVQITTLETSVVRLEGLRREAHLRKLRLEASAPPEIAATVNTPTPIAVTSPGSVAPLIPSAVNLAEANSALDNAIRDYAEESNRYFAAVCDAGKRLANVENLTGVFMSSNRNKLVECPKRSFDLEPGKVSSNEDPAEQIQSVRVVLDHYGVLASSYMLPILFGMLGALTFALRDMISTPKNMGDLPIVTGYVLRVFLGAIFGLIIGYVNISGTPAAGLAASPLLLSLVAGFATDAVISLLDRIALAVSYVPDRLENSRERQTLDTRNLKARPSAHGRSEDAGGGNEKPPEGRTQQGT